MTSPLPLFPLNTVLFPGLVLPLHVFEERYRDLIQFLVDLPDGTPREFGVVAIHRGNEVVEPPSTTSIGDDEQAVTLYSVGCVASVRQVTHNEDGTYDIVAVGTRRFQIADLAEGSEPYLLAVVRPLAEDGADSEGDEAQALATRVLALFREYLEVLRPNDDLSEQLPGEPQVLSYLVAAAAELTTDDRQRLLASPDTASRLRSEIRILTREKALLSQIRAVPSPLSRWAVAPRPN